jgi:hypothetical protein
LNPVKVAVMRVRTAWTDLIPMHVRAAAQAIKASAAVNAVAKETAVAVMSVVRQAGSV